MDNNSVNDLIQNIIHLWNEQQKLIQDLIRNDSTEAEIEWNEMLKRQFHEYLTKCSVMEKCDALKFYKYLKGKCNLSNESILREIVRLQLLEPDPIYAEALETYKEMLGVVGKDKKSIIYYEIGRIYYYKLKDPIKAIRYLDSCNDLEVNEYSQKSASLISEITIFNRNWTMLNVQRVFCPESSR